MSDMQGDQPKKRRFFQRTRERIEEFEKTHGDFRAVVEHLDTHKEAYFAGAGCLVLGFLAGKHNRRPISLSPIFNTTITPLVDSATPTFEQLERLEPVLEDRWNILGLSTDELKLLLTDPEEHLHFETPNVGNICIQHINPLL